MNFLIFLQFCSFASAAMLGVKRVDVQCGH